MENSPATVFAVDVETSGLNPFHHSLLSLSLVPIYIDAPPLELFVKHASISWTEKAREYFRRYKSAWARAAVVPLDAMNALRNYLAEHVPDTAILVGHNVGFDLAFLKQLAHAAGQHELPGISHRTIDTHTLLHTLVHLELLPAGATNSSDAFHHFGIAVPDKQRHTATGDAIATKQLYLTLLEVLSSYGARYSSSGE